MEERDSIEIDPIAMAKARLELRRENLLKRQAKLDPFISVFTSGAFAACRKALNSMIRGKM